MKLSQIASLLTVLIVGVLVGMISYAYNWNGWAEERYMDGLLQGHCDRDCQWTHDGGLETNVRGIVRPDDECVCQRDLGEPDWEATP